MYNLTARGLSLSENVVLFDKFINSFHFLPYLEKKFENRAGGSGLFSVMAPSPVYILENKITKQVVNNSEGSAKRTDFYSVDSNKAMTYGITRIGLPQYYWAPGEASLLNEFARIHFNDSLAVNNVFNSDSLVYSRAVSNGGIEGKELLLKSVFNDSYTRLRMMHYGNAIFIINIKADKSLVTDKNADLFFSSFRFTDEHYQSTAFISKTGQLLKDLVSPDTLVSHSAYAAISGN